METLNYEAELKRVFDRIEETREAVLATSSKDNPTVRFVSIIFYDNKIFFQTGIDLIKYEQICENKNVALCFGNVQIEGIANILGKPTEHDKFIEIFEKQHKNSFETYSKLDKEILIEIMLKKITIYEYDKNRNPYRIFIDLDNKKSHKKMYLE